MFLGISHALHPIKARAPCSVPIYWTPYCVSIQFDLERPRWRVVFLEAGQVSSPTSLQPPGMTHRDQILHDDQT